MYRIDKSPIHGRGVIANQTLPAGQFIDMGIQYCFKIWPYVTPHFGSYINHSSQPNTGLKYLNNNTRQGYGVVALRPIQKNEELTLNYDQCPWYIIGSMPWYR